MATPRLTKYTLPGALGPILVDVRTSGSDPRPVVLVLHGFKGFKDWGMFPLLAERLARAGFAAVSFNMSGSGADDEGNFSEPERFGHNTFTHELDDIATVISALDNRLLGITPSPALGLFGHSRGGGMAILTAAREPRVQALVTWAAISHVNRWRDQAAAWRERGQLDIVNTRTGQVLPLYTDVLDDLTAHGAGSLDIRSAARRVGAPWLILHGEADPTVPVAEAEALAESAREREAPTRLLTIAGAGHTFGATHPLGQVGAELAEAVDETLKWMGRYL